MAWYGSSEALTIYIGQIRCFRDNFWLGMVDRETPDGTYRCVDGTSSPYIVWYGGSPGCHDSDSHYAYDNTEGAKCKESDSSTKPAMCEKCKSFRWQENIIVI